MDTLKGEALKAKAVELDIKGRTTMKADELRQAIQTVLDSHKVESAKKVGYGRSLLHTVRLANYERQNGTTKLTARQARRLRKAINRLPF